MASILLFNKPFMVLSQFTDKEQRETLSDYIQEPKTQGFYPAGRLDRDSEGLLILTNDGALQSRISHPKHKLPKLYWAQVEGEIDSDALRALRNGIQLSDGPTLPARAERIAAPDSIWAREPPIRKRAAQATSWLSLTIVEGRNRQVRRMTAAVGFPTLRLIRMQIGPWSLGELKPGGFRWENCNLPLNRAPKITRAKSTRPR